MEIYADDLLVKSGNPTQHLDDLREAIVVFQQYKIKLNPAKCTFGVGSRKFLGFMMLERRIKANPEKVEAILNMPLLNSRFQEASLTLVRDNGGAQRLGQMLTDFVAVFIGFPKEIEHAKPMKPWQVFVDDSYCRARGGVGVYIIMDKDEEYDYAAKLAFKTTNKKVEYEVLFFCLTISKSLGVEEVEVRATPKSWLARYEMNS
ncbi:uncharacterized protein LOC122289220 [Carya illinoinensis]|uniref:uncharacterized protein LOC122289220 n=1 Tax=Carya illinoinensis TaxID=32201 RepID=UPI001C71F72E|nr:uncharacterized protein LOC122289220 [Carya illinoinensis]